MKRHFFVIALVALILAACSESINELGEITPDKETPTDAKTIVLSPEELCLVQQIANKTPKISPEAAQETAIQLLGLQPQSSSLTKKMSATVFCNKKKVYNSLTKSYKQEEDTAFYVFNTPDNQGFAIVAADIRVPKQVLAYSEYGNFDVKSNNMSMNYFLNLAKDYVAECILVAETRKDSLIESINQKIEIKKDTNIHPVFCTKKRVEKIKLTNLCYTSTQILSQNGIAPLIKTNWSQEQPYNCVIGVYKQAGCVNIALCQLITYWKQIKNYKTTPLDWNLLNDDSNKNKDDYRKQVGNLAKYVGDKVNTEYQKDDSPGDGSLSPKFLKDEGYICNDFTCYSYEQTTNSIANKRPVFMIGQNIYSFYGHAWLADGYYNQKEKTQCVITYVVIETDDNNNTTHHFEKEITAEYTLDCSYLHINWGWGPEYNGYYFKDIFDTKKRLRRNSDGTFENDPYYSTIHNNNFQEIFKLTNVKPLK